ncbi:MAG: 2-oxo-4-hydroxy-4-carboxy-5-ureidoimidazoline decarboxylase [Rhodobacteraceae bacterium]|nr:2-oxo-4-hydroxy-4-carboxy-5-ureidoimidazoline decarboxylase [Paracoccaceae bacterium]
MNNPTDRAQFVAQYGGVYEFSPWVAEKLFDQADFASAAPIDLAGPMAAVVESAPMELQLTLLRAHPDLGERLAVANDKGEDKAGLENCLQAEFDAFSALNSSYRESFGFPFITILPGRTRQQLLEEFRTRIEHDRATEFRAALNHLHQVARLRLEAMG